jgi:flagellar motor protein MotB
VIHRTVLRPGPKTLRASGDRWLFGYADVVTLLFACFAALYAAQATTTADAAAATAAVEAANKVEKADKAETVATLEAQAGAHTDTSA